MLSLLFVTLNLDSLFLGTGLLALSAGFALESVWTRDRRYVVLSVVCASVLVAALSSFVSFATVATFALVGVQISGVVVFFLFFRHWLHSPTTSRR